MASEPTESREDPPDLPPELDEWLDNRADELDVDRNELLEQLLATFRDISEGEAAVASETSDRDVIESIVRDVFDEQFSDIVSATAEQVEEEPHETRIEDVEAEFQEKIEDVRERVIQVKRETDQKASDEHEHDVLEDLESRIENIWNTVEALEEHVDTRASAKALEAVNESVEDNEQTLSKRATRLEKIEDRLRTLAWAVNDLRDEEEDEDTGEKTLERIKTAAARNDVSRAVCENCGEGVQIGLMTRPACPHCDAVVTNVESASGFFSKPSLITASQIEGPVESGSSNDDISKTKFGGSSDE